MTSHTALKATETDGLGEANLCIDTHKDRQMKKEKDLLATLKCILKVV